MNYLEELYDLYDKNQDHVGEIEPVPKKTKKGIVTTQLVLLPISHATVTAQITVTVDLDGNFVNAAPVEEDDKLTIIPVTEESASRTAGKAPHPLCDNLKYLAGDYMEYYDNKSGKEKDFAENYQLYMKALKRWNESEYSHEKVRAVYSYLKKRCLLRDLISAGIISLNEDGKMDEKEKLQSISQTDAFVRFCIRQTKELDEQILADKMGGSREECWKDKTLMNSYIEYYRSIQKEKVMSYLSGNIEAVSYLQPKKIRNEGDGAKLISSNDKDNFTFRGRFTDKTEAMAIGYEDSQKAHNALKWIIRRQGYSWDSLCVVIWESGLKRLPNLWLDTDEICDEYEGWGDEEEEDDYLGTNEIEAFRFAMAMRGYGRNLGQSSRTILLALDSATPGRLSLIEYKSYESSNYLKNIQKWHTACEWQHVKYKDGRPFIFTGMVGIDDIAAALYGTEQNKILSMNGKTKLYGEVLKRLLPCISEGRSIPEDMVRLSVQRASSPVSYKERYNWERILAVACSLVKKQRNERNSKEVWRVALDANCDERDYLFGRLLAVADRVEYRTYEKDDRRETNALRYMGAFVQNPMRTWLVLEEKLQPYWMRLSTGERIVYKNLIDKIFDKFTVDAYRKEEKLGGLFLLGFHSQSIALRNKPDNEQKEEDKKND